MYGERFLSILVCLEVFMLLVFLFSCLFFNFEKNMFGVLIIIIFISMAVCEAVLGLALLVSSSRLCSFYRFHPFSVLKF